MAPGETEKDLVGLSVADRIRWHRERLMLTVDEAAAMAGVTGRMWRHWEAGTRLVGSTRTLTLIGHVLNVKDIRELTGEPFVTGPDAVPQHEAVPLLRAELTRMPALRSTTAVIPDTQALEAKIRQAWRVWQSPGETTFDRVGLVLPGLLADVEGWLATDPSELARRDATWVYLLVRSFLKSVGEFDLALVAGARGMSAVNRTGDPGTLAAATWNWAQALSATSRPVDSRRVAEDALALVTRDGRETTKPTIITAVGALHLIALIGAVRLDDARSVQMHLTEAAALARRLGTDAHNDWWVAFGPTNVAIHKVACLVEQGQSRRAATGAQHVRWGNSPSVERQTTHLIEVASSLARLGDDGESLARIRQALALSPDRVIRTTMARETVALIWHRARRTMRADATTVAHAIGLLLA